MLREEKLTGRIIGLAMEVHTNFGPGLLESAYEDCLCLELGDAGIPFRRQVGIATLYKGRAIADTYRADIVVADRVIVELKSVEALTRLHEAQILTYLRLSGLRIGMLLNFNVVRLKQGLRRYAL
jgi:GxxExxY protein